TYLVIVIVIVVIVVMLVMAATASAPFIVLATFVAAVGRKNHFNHHPGARAGAIAVSIAGAEGQSISLLEADPLAQRTFITAIGAVIVAATIIESATAAAIVISAVVAVLIAALVGRSGNRGIAIVIMMVLGR